jgi:hypothetical protein
MLAKSEYVKLLEVGSEIYALVTAGVPAAPFSEPVSDQIPPAAYSGNQYWGTGKMIVSGNKFISMSAVDLMQASH